jgi:hypothetical protein
MYSLRISAVPFCIAIRVRIRALRPYDGRMVNTTRLTAASFDETSGLEHVVVLSVSGGCQLLEVKSLCPTEKCNPSASFGAMSGNPK